MGNETNRSPGVPRPTSRHERLAHLKVTGCVWGGGGVLRWADSIHGSTRSWATPLGMAQSPGVQGVVAQQGQRQRGTEDPGTSKF